MGAVKEHYHDGIIIQQQQEKVIMTGSVPLCPHCKRPTSRTGGNGSVTTAYYPPIFDEKGNNTNPDKNIKTSTWLCNECGNGYTIKGNKADGYHYN